MEHAVAGREFAAIFSVEKCVPVMRWPEEDALLILNAPQQNMDGASKMSASKKKRLKKDKAIS